MEKQVRDVEVTETGTGEEGIEIALQEKPGVVLVDIQLPLMDGIETARRIKRDVPHCRIITMSMFVDKGKQFVIPQIAAFIEKGEIDSKLVPLLNKILRQCP